jgi:demethylmenaquinone methyltransferase/2-methoxy-6-polyprenyl-1,4-benzoquinol methylase
MSSFAWMRVLESTPERYDRGVRLLSRGRIDAVWRRIAELAAEAGPRVLDLGCGTGGVALACATLSAQVLAVDRDAGMLEVARAKPVPQGGAIEWRQLAVGELEDVVAPGSLDAFVSCLAFSELSGDERRYALRMARSALRVGGVVVIADEVAPRGALRRAWHTVARAPRAGLAYALTQTTTRAIDDLAEPLRSAGFDAVREERPWPAFAIVRGVQP